MELDTSFMTEDELANHKQLIDQMGIIWEMTEKIQNSTPEEPVDRETRQQMREIINETRPLMEAERSTMFRQLADERGLNDEESADFSAYVDDIISTTTLRSPRGMGSGRGGR